MSCNLGVRSRGLLAACAGILLGHAHALAEPGVTNRSIVFGQSAPSTGSAATLGIGMRAGLEAAFAEANRQGGVQGHRITLISRDDGYDPTRSIAAARLLIDRDHVFALVGSVGTPTSVAVQPIADESGVPFVGAFTGAEFLRNPYQADVVNVRASYFQETETMVDHLTRDSGITRIAVFDQDDAFGRAGFAGVKRALAKRGLAPVAEGRYDRKTLDVTDALQTITAAKPDAVILIGTHKPCAQFIRLARQAQLKATFINISFVDAEALAKDLGPGGAGVVITGVVPFPADTSRAIVGQYQAALHAYDASQKPGFVSLEGYVVGRVAIAALQRIQGPITRHAFEDVFSSGTRFNLGGMTLTYGAGNNRGSNDVYLSEINQDGTLLPIDHLPGGSAVAQASRQQEAQK
jgi:branched-chain amino acid transport system substrate-binding protein